MKKQAECENLGDTVKILSVRPAHGGGGGGARHSSRHMWHLPCCSGSVMVRDTADHACRLMLSDVVACPALQSENARLKEENLQLQAKVDVLMSQLHGQVR